MNKFLRLRTLVALGAEQLTEDELQAIETPNDASREVLTSVRPALRALADQLRDAERTDEVVATLQEIAQAVADVQAELDARPDPDAIAASLLAAINGDPGSASETNHASTATAPPRPRLGQVTAPRAGRPRVNAMTATAGRATARVVLPLSGMREAGSVADIAHDLEQALRSSRRGVPVVVASVRTEYPEERMLRGGSTAENDAKLRAVTEPAALVATGGVCSPVTVDYSVPVFATAERPVRDALARFGADRGGITFTPPPTIATADAGVTVWTEVTDANPSGATKAVYDVVCGSPDTVLVDAITTRLKIGNMAGRFYPEWVAAITENALAFAARTADTRLLDLIKAASTTVTITPTVGATRGILEAIDQTIAAVRYRMRLSDQARFRAILPAWAREMIRSDLARELAHDTDGRDPLSVTNAEIDAFFNARNINVTWHLDGVAADATVGEVYAAQTFAAQAPSSALVSYPAQVVFPIFPEGSWQFLDGGELNLGVIRDSATSATNDYETFVETFEHAAFRGIESLWVIATVAPTGASAGTVTPAYP